MINKSNRAIDSTVVLLLVVAVVNDDDDDDNNDAWSWSYSLLSLIGIVIWLCFNKAQKLLS